MPVARVQLADGRIGRFEVPDGTSSSDVEAFISSQMQPAPAAPNNQALESSLAAEPTQNGMIENLGRGLVQGGKSAITGAVGLGADSLGAIFPKNEAIQNLRELLPEAQARSNIQYQANTGDSMAAGVGNAVGQAAPYMFLPSAAATLPGRIALGAAGGALAGATAPSEMQQSPEEALASREGNAVMGGITGGAVPAITTGVSKGVPALIKKFANINPVAAKDFMDSGVQMSLGALTNSPSIQLADKWLSKFATSADIMQKNTYKTLDDIQNIIGKSGADKAVTNQEAGRVIQEGGKNYINRFQDVSNKLYNKVDQYIKPDSKVAIANSANELQNILGNASTPNLLERVQSNSGVRVLQDLTADDSNGTLPYSALKTYRTIIGQELSSPHLIGGTEIPIYKRAYGALTKDMEQAALANGDKAFKAFNRANTFYKNGITNIENNLQNTLLKNAPEDAYQAAMAGTAKGGTRINSIMRSLKPHEQEIIEGTVLRQLGLAKPGAQNAAGDLFSTNTFLTNWNKMSPEAKTAIFRNKSTADALDKVTKIASSINQIDRFGNPSGTAQQLGFSGVLLGLLTSPVKTSFGIGAANASARLMTNQKFIKWLSNAAIAKTPGALNSEIGKLKVVATQNPSIARDIAHYITMIGIVSNRGQE